MISENSNHIICPNCENEFEKQFDFCPHCGQKNKPLSLHFKYFISEFLSGSFNLDSKIFRTLELLILHPGKLTKEFIAGKRMNYLPPVRLYLIISLVYFTILSFSNSEVFKFKDTSTDNSDQQIVFGLDEQDTVKVDVPGVIDTVLVANNDSTQLGSKTKKILKRMSTKEGRAEFNERLPRYISVGMFILMPLTALIFYLMFFKNTFYIQHLVFVLHLQSAMYMLFIVFNLVELGIDNDWVDGINVLLFLFLLLIWIKKFYGLKWFKSIWKTFAFLFFYGLLFLLFLVVVAGVNVWFM